MSMSPPPVTQLDRTVLRHLQKQSRPLQLRRIASDLRESRHRVVESLLRLQKMREVRRNARGEWIARTVATTTPAPVRGSVGGAAAGELEIHGSGRMEVNHRWLSLRLPREDQRREFMETMGLAVTLRDDQDSDDFWEVATFDEAVRCLFERHRQWWLEFAQIDRPSRSPGFADLERPGLCNRVLLLEPPKLRYHARLHGELLRLAREITDEELDRSALRYVFPHATPPDRSGVQPSTSVPESPFEGADGVAEYALLNEDQRAVQSGNLTSADRGHRPAGDGQVIGGCARPVERSAQRRRGALRKP